MFGNSQIIPALRPFFTIVVPEKYRSITEIAHHLGFPKQFAYDVARGNFRCQYREGRRLIVKEDDRYQTLDSFFAEHGKPGFLQTVQDVMLNRNNVDDDAMINGLSPKLAMLHFLEQREIAVNGQVVELVEEILGASAPEYHESSLEQQIVVYIQRTGRAVTPSMLAAIQNIAKFRKPG